MLRADIQTLEPACPILSGGIEIAQTQANLLFCPRDKLLGPAGLAGIIGTGEGAWRMTQGRDKPAVVLTIGHSNRPLEAFLDLLRAHSVDRVIDVRTIPRSRHNPQFNADALAESLGRAGIHYTHLKALGGLRRPKTDSRNLGWRNASFRGFADYMQTADFDGALNGLLQIAACDRCAVMCAEAVPWRCHRSLIADALLARGVGVEHIVGGKQRQTHRLTAFARIHGKRVTYPEDAPANHTSPSKTRQRELEFDSGGATMPGKKRKRKFTAAKEARRRARAIAGAPPAARVIPDKRHKPPKHKKAVSDLAEI